MNLFDPPQARHFCAPSAATMAAVSSQSLAAFHAGLPTSALILVEGTSRFEVHQVNLLQSTQRWLTFALAHYRRAVDMMVPASAPWAHVTLYYSSYFAANAILGMFGGWIGLTKAGARLVEVERKTPGNQALRVHRRLVSPNGAVGSHRVFWDFYYDSAASLLTWAPPELQSALQPVTGDYGWQIAQRNLVNYDMFEAWSASTDFYKTFKPKRFSSLQGPLQLQLESTHRLVKLGCWFANDLALSGLAIHGCGFSGTRQQVQRRLVTQPPPSLVTQAAFSDLLDA